MFRGNAVDVDPLNPMLFRCEKRKGNRRQYSTVHFISLKPVKQILPALHLFAAEWNAVKVHFCSIR